MSSQSVSCKKANSSGKALHKLDLQGHDLPPSPASSTPRNGRKYALATELVHTESNDQFNASTFPIYTSATFKGVGKEYDYSRSGNPTRTHLQNHLAKVMKANGTFAVAAGITCLDVILALLDTKTGDEVIAGEDLYGGTHRALKFSGAKVYTVDTTDPEVVKKYISKRTCLILLETPTNPLFKIADIETIARYAHQVKRGPRPEVPKNQDESEDRLEAEDETPPVRFDTPLVVVDNTMLSPMLLNPLDLGSDLVFESGTKYLSGHHDLTSGVIAYNDQVLGNWMAHYINVKGCALDPFQCAALMRGVKTLSVRFEKQQASAMRIARYLELRGLKVRYPGLKSHPQYELHRSMANGAGAVLSFETGDIELSERIVESAQLWGISVSFGCVNSLISMPCRMSHASIDAKTRAKRKLPEDLIRLCVGIEDVDDLIEDLERALAQAGAIHLLIDAEQAAPTDVDQVAPTDGGPSKRRRLS